MVINNDYVSYPLVMRQILNKASVVNIICEMLRNRELFYRQRSRLDIHVDIRRRNVIKRSIVT